MRLVANMRWYPSSAQPSGQRLEHVCALAHQDRDLDKGVHKADL